MPQELLKNASVPTATTYYGSSVFESQCGMKYQNMTSPYTSKTAFYNEIYKFDSNNEDSSLAVQASCDLPAIDEFQEYYTADDLPEYAVVLGSKVSTYNNRATGIAYREARGTNNTTLSVVYERLLKYYSDKGVATFKKGFPKENDQLLFVHIETCSEKTIKYKPISSGEGSDKIVARDVIVQKDIRINGSRSPIDILKTLIDQKLRDLIHLFPVPQVLQIECNKNIFTKLLCIIKESIENGAHDEVSINKYKDTVEKLWHILFIKEDKLHNKKKRTKKDCLDIASQDLFKITIKVVSSGKEIVLRVKSTDTVTSVKAEIFKCTRIPSEDQTLILKVVNEVEMENNLTLDQYNVTAESNICLVLKLRGAGGDPATNERDCMVDEEASLLYVRPENSCLFKHDVECNNKNYNSNLHDCLIDEQATSLYVCPENPRFTPSLNGRAGRHFVQCYKLKYEVSLLM